ncbi:pilus assembly protein [Chlorobaculum sp. MV4-Y]|jgi:Flp pilus assembly protein TadG|uniref:TadE/TadG family type IV pilus assembly protein n=1 Tax=Chlorobaculum sp. MV4-Y TaxID=2976335 RepID=UPI0021AF99B0|nr:TadE/TadG family type IV pilus assembly protein [Chlorobaculum sp. MV4-Y]UWX58017.1 pilus assembly protein [Chlorobaculum sp. MV4-Y]
MNRMRTNIAMLRAPASEHTQTQKGAVMVEFAFILPIFLLLLFGVITFSVALYNRTVLCLAVREGARMGALYDANNYDSNGNFVSSNVITKANAAAMQVLNNDLVTFGPGMNPTATTSVSGAAGQRTVTVTANINYTGLYIFSNALSLSATTIMRLEED